MRFWPWGRRLPQDAADPIADRVEQLERELAALRQDSPPAAAGPPIVIEHIHIERVIVDKLDYENNFGALGIRELSGQLNIGANYRTGPPRRGGEAGKRRDGETGERSGAAAQARGKGPGEPDPGPLVHVRSRPDKP